MQLKNLENELRKSYTARYDFEQKNVVQLANTNYRSTYLTGDGDGNVVFNVINCRIAKTVRFTFLKTDFTIPGALDINAGGETKWVLTLKLTPIVDY